MISLEMFRFVFVYLEQQSDISLVSVWIILENSPEIRATLRS